MASQGLPALLAVAMRSASPNLMNHVPVPVMDLEAYFSAGLSLRNFEVASL
jgi:hypothetical protein